MWAILDLGLEKAALSKLFERGNLRAVEALFDADKRRVLKDAMIDLGLEKSALSPILTYGNLSVIVSLSVIFQETHGDVGGSGRPWIERAGASSGVGIRE